MVDSFEYLLEYIDNERAEIADYCQKTGEAHSYENFINRPRNLFVEFMRYLTKEAECKNCGHKIELEDKRKLKQLDEFEATVEKAFQ